MKLGSLFDGSGGFPLAGALCGIEPIWASEVEPYPIAVTKTRFPNMKHLGDISKINGAEIEPVDVITFGSPCQDLSVAGKRAGLKHEKSGDSETTRSGLFMEAVRIIKEMSERTDGKYPNFAVWENVPGAFSSNKGEDFRIVLEELIKIIEPNAIMPKVPSKGWAYADSYCGNGWSLAYRVFDAQYWGVPQRRRRIYLVLDLRGQRARKILFEREGLQGYFTQSGSPWQATTADAERSLGADDKDGAIPYTLKAGQENPCSIQTIAVATQQGGAEITENGICPTITAAAGMSGNNQPWICQGLDAYNQALTGDKAKTLNSAASDSDHVPCVIVDNIGGNAEYAAEKNISPCLKAIHYKMPPCIVQSAGFCTEHSAQSRSIGYEEDVSPTLRAGVVPACMYSLADRDNVQCITASKASFFMRTEEELASTLVATDYKDPQVVCYSEGNPIAIDRAFFNQGKNALYEPQTYEDGTTPTLVARGPSAVAVHYIVRRLTPTECARLQGFADRWGDIDTKTEFTDEEYRFWLEVRHTHASINGKAVKEYTKAQMLTWYNKLHTDSAEYKMWGNGIALPTALYVLQGVSDQKKGV